MKFILSVVICLSSLEIYAQNYIYHGNTKYQGSNSWVFSASSYGGSSGPSLTVGKDGDKGVLLFEISTVFKTWYVKGELLVFLENGDVIKCIDRGTRDYLDGKSLNLYRLTSSEIEMLKIHRITSVRFSVYEGRLDGLKSYTAENKKSFFVNSFTSKAEDDNQYHTEEEITELFKH